MSISGVVPIQRQKTVIADASPLIALSLIDQLDWLQALFGGVDVVPAVQREVLSGVFSAGEKRIAASFERGHLRLVPSESAQAMQTWARATELPGSALVSADAAHADTVRVDAAHANSVHAAQLDEGETQTLLHALWVRGVSGQAPLLIVDERAGRQVAASCGLSVIGTAALVILAKERGLIVNAKAQFERLHQAGFWIAQPVLRVMLARAGE